MEELPEKYVIFKNISYMCLNEDSPLQCRGSGQVCVRDSSFTINPCSFCHRVCFSVLLRKIFFVSFVGFVFRKLICFLI